MAGQTTGGGAVIVDELRGIRWTFREVLRGKCSIALAICLVIVALALFAAIELFAAQSLGEANSPAGFLDGLVSVKAQEFGQVFGIVFTFATPAIVVLFPVTLLVMKVVYSIRDRNLPRTPENLEAHRREALFAWSWPLSMVVGAVDFTAIYSVFDLPCTIAGVALPVFLSTLLVIACLVVAERRVSYVSRGMASFLPGNYLLVDEVVAGERDGELPEGMRDEFGRARVACVLHLGIVRSLPWAVRFVNGIGLRTRVKLFSGFLNSAIHGMLSAFSFGIASTLANELGAVGGELAAGRCEEYFERATERRDERVRFWPEAVCFAACVVFVTISVFV